MEDKQIYFDVKLVRTLQEEVVPINEDMLAGKDGSIFPKDGFGKLCPECYKLLKDCTCPTKKVGEALIKTLGIGEMASIATGNAQLVYGIDGVPNEEFEVKRTGTMLPIGKYAVVNKEPGNSVAGKMFSTLVVKKIAEAKIKATTSALMESRWFTKEKIAKLERRLARVRQLYKNNPKDSEKHEREGVALEGEIESLQKKLKELKAPKAEMQEQLDDTQVKTPAVSKPTDNVAPDGTHGQEMGTKPSDSAKLSQQVKKIVPHVEGEVKEETETMPTTKPDTKPDTTPRPKSPIAPAPGVSPHPKAVTEARSLDIIKSEISKVDAEMDAIRKDGSKVTLADPLMRKAFRLKAEFNRVKKSTKK